MNNPEKIKVWDPFVRIFHWVLVLAFTVAFVTEDDLLGPHIWSGYLVTSLILLRVIWGFIGSQYARFSDFVFKPAVVMAYLKDTLTFRAKRYIGHNPAGGAMIVALLISILLTGISGVVLLGLDGEGLLATWQAASSDWMKDGLEEVHEFFANFSLLLVFIHVGGVLFESLVHRENLVDAMINGKKMLVATSQPTKET